MSLAGAGCRGPAATRALLADLQQELAVFGEFQDLRVRTAIAADPNIALIVDENPVVGVRPLETFARSAPVVQEIALRIEFEDRWSAGAAFAGLQLERLFIVGKRRGAAMDDPDVVVWFDENANRHSQNPVVRHRFGP